MNVCIFLALSILAGGPAPKSPAGYEFFARTHAEANLSQAVSLADSTVHGWAAGESARVEVIESRNPRLPKGSVLLTTDGGLTVMTAAPGKHKAARQSGPAPKSGPAPVRDAATTAVKVRNLKIETLTDEPGEKMSGFATRHYRFRVSYESSVDFMGDVTETSTARLDDIWTVPDLKLPGMSIWLRRDPPETGSPEVDRKIAAAYAPAAGLLVRRVTASTLSGPSGASQKTKTVWEISRLRAASIPPGTFDPPEPANGLAK